jgi:galactokinase
VPASSCTAFAPGRVNIIGEHTDYNRGLALPFAITAGVTATAVKRADGQPIVQARACDLDESDEFRLDEPPPGEGWRAFLRGAVAELAAAGRPLSGANLEIAGDVPRGAGLSSSAALTVALCLALTALASGSREPLDDGAKLALAQLCSRIENRWTGAQTGLLDQLASLCGEPDSALLIDFDTLQVLPVALALAGWRFVTADSGERHALASSGYNERRSECTRACELLGIGSLRECLPAQLALLPEPLRRRACHVLEENDRVRAAVQALRAEDLAALGPLLDASHASLRDLYEVSTPAVEATVARLREAGAAGARLIGGGFGGAVLGLFAPERPVPPGCVEVGPGPGAYVR